MGSGGPVPRVSFCEQWLTDRAPPKWSVVFRFARPDAQGILEFELIVDALHARQSGDFIMKSLALFFVARLSVERDDSIIYNGCHRGPRAQLAVLHQQCADFLGESPILTGSARRSNRGSRA